MIFSASFGIFSHNTFADTVTATKSLGYYPFDIDVNPNTNRIYVTTFNHVTYNSSYAFVIDGATNSVIDKLWAGYDNGFEGVGVNQKTNRIYVADTSYSRIAIIDGTTDAITETIEGIPYPHYLAVNPSTNKIYVQSNNQDIFVINSMTNTVSKSFRACGTYTMDNQPQGNILPVDVAVNPVTNMAYVACVKAIKVMGGSYQSAASYVAVIDGATDTVLKNVTLGSSNAWPSGIRVNPDTNRIYVGGSPSASVIDGNTNLLMSTINAGCGCSGRVGVNPNTNKVYFSDASNSLTIVDGATNTVIGSVAVGSNPASVGVNPVTNKIYVANTESQTVSVIDGSSSDTSTRPSAPQNLQANGGNAQVTLSWSSPASNGGSAITGYKIYRSTSSGTETGYVSLGNVTSYTNTGVTGGTTYFYKVRAVNSVGISPASNEASATP